MTCYSQGELETIIGNALIKFQKERLGRGAESAKAYILDDMIIVRLEKALTLIEKSLLQREEGKKLIKELRFELSETMRPQLEALISETIGMGVKSVHFDVSTKTGECIYVFILQGKLYPNGLSNKS